MQYVYERMDEANEAGTLQSREFYDPVAAMQYTQDPEGFQRQQAANGREADRDAKDEAPAPQARKRRTRAVAVAESDPQGDSDSLKSASRAPSSTVGQGKAPSRRGRPKRAP